LNKDHRPLIYCPELFDPDKTKSGEKREGKDRLNELFNVLSK
jgi:hypothetical protein